jgi:hypothetical protein
MGLYIQLRPVRPGPRVPARWVGAELHKCYDLCRWAFAEGFLLSGVERLSFTKDSL